MKEQRERTIIYDKFKRTGVINRDHFKVLYNILVAEVKKIVLNYLVRPCKSYAYWTVHHCDS